MAKPVQRENLKWEEQMASVSLAGIRPLAQATVSPGSSSESTYTITDRDAKRAVLLHTGGDTDIRFDVNATASATSFPVLGSVYFVLEVEKDDVIHVFNTSGGSITVHIMEIR